jgi:hypothetical protein
MKESERVTAERTMEANTSRDSPRTVLSESRAIAQVVSRWVPTVAARFRDLVRSCGICSGQSVTGAGFLRVLQFPLPIFIPPTAPHSLSFNRSWYNKPIRGRRTKWTQFHPPPQETKKKSLRTGDDGLNFVCTCSKSAMLFASRTVFSEVTAMFSGLENRN